jgi:hypothetical protein
MGPAPLFSEACRAHFYAGQFPVMRLYIQLQKHDPRWTRISLKNIHIGLNHLKLEGVLSHDPYKGWVRGGPDGARQTRAQFAVDTVTACGGMSWKCDS